MHDNDVPDLCEAIGELMPGAGEPRVNADEIFAHVHVRVVDLMAGTAGELLLHPDLPPLGAKHDFVEANACATIRRQRWRQWLHTPRPKQMRFCLRIWLSRKR
jgi:hypothetical protein